MLMLIRWEENGVLRRRFLIYTLFREAKKGGYRLICSKRRREKRREEDSHRFYNIFKGKKKRKGGWALRREIAHEKREGQLLT